MALGMGWNMASSDRSYNKALRPKTKGIPFRTIDARSGRAEFSVPLDFKYHAASKEQLEKMNQEIEYAFGGDIDLFCVSERDQKPKIFYPLVARPPRYFSLLADYIRNKFPSEAEAREYVSFYRSLFLWNMITFIVIKRICLILALLIMVESPEWIKRWGVDPWLGSPWFSPWVSYELFGLVAAILVMFVVNMFVVSRYRDSYKISSQTVSIVIQQRFNDLSLFFSNSITDIDRAGAHIGRNPDAWNEQAKFLTRLALYVAKRVEYFERHVQIEMWRIRRLRHWTLLGGLVSLLLVVTWFSTSQMKDQLVTLTVSVEKLVQQARSAIGEANEASEDKQTKGIPAFPKDATGDAESKHSASALWKGIIYLTGLILLSFVSMQYGRVPASAARDAMHADNWRRYGHLEVDEEIGSQVGRDKRLLAQNAQQNIFQQPSNPPHRSTLSPVGHRSGGSSQRLELVDGYEAGDPVNASQRRYS